MKCPECGKFVKNAEYLMAHDERVCIVEAECKNCGVVNPKDWEWDTINWNKAKQCPCDADYCHVYGSTP